MAKLYTITEVAERSGVSPSALRFYERKGLIAPRRTESGHRRYPVDVLRRVALITVGQSLQLSLEEIGAALARLPQDRVPQEEDWRRVSGLWRERLQRQIAHLEAVRERLDVCIGCGCLSLRDCALANRQDRAARHGSGPRFLLGDRPEGDGEEDGETKS